jgi:peptidoglycan/LPS O-acetylase OafA/YrhL
MIVRRFLMASGKQIQSLVQHALSTSNTSVRASHQAPRSFVSIVFGWPPPQLDRSRETAWLDGLRGLAAFLVMTYHYHLAWYGPDLEKPWSKDDRELQQFWRLPFIRLFACSGHAQVSVFFVLSGFVLSWSPLKSIRQGRHEKLAQNLASSTFRRWFRLFLPCFIVGLLSLLQLRWGIIDITGVEVKETFLQQLWDYIWACEAFANPFFLERSEMEAIHKYSWTMWTIPYEFAGSLVVFLLLLAVSQTKRYGRRTIISMGVSIYAFLHAEWNYWLFVSGVLIADYVQQFRTFEMKSSNLLAQTIWTTVFIASLYLAGLPDDIAGHEFLKKITPTDFIPIEGGARFWWCWSGIIIIVSACHLSSLRGVFELSFLRYLGRISYMLYLTHRSVQDCVGGHIRKQLLTAMGAQWSDEFKNTTTPSTPIVQLVTYLLSWLVMLPIALFLANWCEILIDRPCTRFAKWVNDKFADQHKAGGSREKDCMLLPSWTSRGDIFGVYR